MIRPTKTSRCDFEPDRPLSPFPDDAVIETCSRLRADRQGLALMDKPTGECIFLEGRDCSVQPVKPQQCRDFPNGWNFPGFEKVCRAVPRMVE